MNKSLRIPSLAAAMLLAVVQSPVSAAVEIDSLSNFNTDFEAGEGYTSGFLASDPLWNIGGTSLPEVGSFAYTGSLGLNLDGDGAISIDFTSLETPNVGWIDLYLKPSFSAPEDLATSFPLGQAALTGFVTVGSDGEVYVLHGDGAGNGTWMATGYTLPLSGSSALDWLRLTYRLDYSNQRWDLFLDESLQMIDIGFVDASAPPLSKFSLEGSSEGATHFDQFTAGFINPLFTDADNDGMDDAYELVQGLSTLSNDRAGDLDLDGILNVAEYMDGLAAGNADTDGDGVHDGAELAAGANPLVADAYDLAAVPYLEDFESYATGDLAAQSFWQINGSSAFVQNTQSFSGSQALEFLAGASDLELGNHFDGSTVNPVWLSFYFQPVRFPETSDESVNALLDAGVTSVFYFLEGNRIAVLDGDGQGAGTWIVLDHAASLTDWTYVSVKNDYSSQQFQLWVNDVPLGDSYAFAHTQPYFNRFTVKQNDTPSAFLDDILISAQQPQGVDTDGDAIPDGWEHHYGLDPSDPTDAAANPDGDYLTNLDEYTFGTDPTLNDSDGDGLPDGYALSGAVRVEVWHDIDTSFVSSLTSDPDFPYSPDATLWLDRLESPRNVDDYYGQRVRGFIIPDETRDYVFYLTADNQAEFWLSTDAHAYNKSLVIGPSGGGWNNWTQKLEQSSQLVSLQAGVRYYFEILHKEFRGGDHFQVGWSEPGGAISTVPGANLQSWQPDAEDLDDDALQDSWELANGLDPADNGSTNDKQGGTGDYDYDGLSNLIESQLGTSVTLADSDNDTYIDWAEQVYFGTSAVDALDLPAPTVNQSWQTQAIGTPISPAAYDEVSTDKLHLLAAGDGIDLRTSDSTGYFYQTVTGDFSVTMSYDKADQAPGQIQSGGAVALALMARESLDADSRYISALTRRALSAFNLGARLETGADSFRQENLVSYPSSYDKAWVRLERRGNSFFAYASSDNATWALIGEQSLDLPQSLHLGFSVYSGNTLEYTSAVIEVTEWNTDFDRDGIWDADEALYGTSVTESDSDGDGYSDHEEIFGFFTDPTVADLDPETIADSNTGSESVSQLGDWIVDGAVTYSREGRGAVEYEMTLPGDAIYRISLIGQTRFNETGTNLYNVKVSVDGVYIGRIFLNDVESEAGAARILSPWLKAGTHTLRFYVDNTYTYRSLQINEVSVGYVGGPDVDQDTIPDWMANRLAQINGFDNASATAVTQSAISPFCLKGRSRYLDFSESTDALQLLSPLPAYEFYTDVTLDSSVDTSVTLDFENDGLTQTAQIEWVATNVADTPAITIRKGDALLLTAFEAATLPTDSVVIDLGDGSAAVTTTVDTPLEALFDAAGEFIVTATVNSVAHQITVTVMEAELGDSISLLIARDFNFQPTALSDDAVVEIDAAVTMQEVTQTGQPREFILTGAESEPAVLAASTPSGAVLDHVALENFDLASNQNTRIEVVEYYNDGAALVEVDFVMSNPPADLRLVVRIFVGGITFDDGSIEKTLTVSDFDEVGRTTLKFIMPFEAISSVCHRIYVYNGDEFLGQR